MKEQEITPAKLAARRYFRQIWLERSTTFPAMILPGIGSIFVAYLPPLIIAAILERFSDDRPELQEMLPYLFAFGGVWLTGEILWRIGFYFLNRADSRGMRNLYTQAMQELAKKDINFFHNNFAGSLTKKALGYGRNFEGFMDTLTFNIMANLIPVIFASVILWRMSPWLVVALIGLMGIVAAIVLPLVKKRRRLVRLREDASNVMAGHVADSIGNMDAVQAFANEAHELKHHQQNLDDYIHKAVRSWDFHVLRIDTLISPLYVFINVVGLAIAIMFAKDGASMATIFITFSYYVYITRILWDFNRIYRNIENALTEAAQFTELLLIPNTVNEVEKPITLKITEGEVRFNSVTFAYINNFARGILMKIDARISG